MVMKYSTTPKPVWVQLPEAFYLTLQGRMSLVSFNGT